MLCPPITKNSANIVNMLMSSVLLRRIESGKTGSAERRSTSTKPASSTRPSTSCAHTMAALPCWSSVTALTTSMSEQNRRTLPGLSSLPGCAGLRLGRILRPIVNSTMPKGTFTRKMPPHDAMARMNPPRVGPMSAPRLAAVAIQPRAWPRSLVGKVSVMMP